MEILFKFARNRRSEKSDASNFAYGFVRLQCAHGKHRPVSNPVQKWIKYPLRPSEENPRLMVGNRLKPGLDNFKR